MNLFTLICYNSNPIQIHASICVCFP